MTTWKALLQLEKLVTLILLTSLLFIVSLWNMKGYKWVELFFQTWLSSTSGSTPTCHIWCHMKEQSKLQLGMLSPLVLRGTHKTSVTILQNYSRELLVILENTLNWCTCYPFCALERYNNYLKVSGGVVGDATCNRAVKATDVHHISEDTPLIRLVSLEDTTKNDWLYLVLMDIVSLNDINI